MNELMLVNPRHRRRRRGRRRMSALQRMYFGRGRARRNPRRRRRVAALASAAPARRVSRRRRSVSRFRRSRGGGGFGGFNVNTFINRDLVPAGVGAAGALGLDVALGYVRPNLPAFLQSGVGDTIVRLAGAVGIGWAAGQVMGARAGEQAMAGAITVTLYDFFRDQLSATGLLSGYDMGWVSPAMPMNEYVGEYVGY